jgi:multiple sugar transport system substrate-binding protein
MKSAKGFRWLMAIAIIVPMVLGACAPAPAPAPAAPAAPAAQEPAAPAAEQPTAAPAPAKTVEIEFWYGLGGKLGEVVTDFIDRYNASQTEVKVIPVVSPDYDTTQQKLQAGIAAKKPPAVALVKGEKVAAFIDAGVTVPLNDMAAKYGYPLDDLAPAFANLGKRGDQQLSIPLYGTTQVMYYRSDIFKELGIDPEQAFKSWQTLAEAAAKCTVVEDGEVKRYGWEPMWEVGSNNMIDAVLAAGGDILSEDGKTVLIDEPVWIEVWDSFRKWIHEDKIMRIHYGGEGWAYWYDTIADVMEGRACGYVGSSGDQGDLDFTKIAAHIQPGWNDNPPSPRALGHQVIILKDAPVEQQEAAFKFLAYFTQPDMTAEWSVRTGYLPMRLSAATSPVLVEAAKTQPEKLVPPAQLEYAVSAFVDPTGGKILDAINKAADKVQIEGLPAADALAEAAKEAQAALDSMK